MSAKLAGLLEDLSRRLKKIETSAVKKKHYGHKQPAENRENKQAVLHNVQAKPAFIPNVSQGNRQGVFPANQQVCVLTFRRRIYSKIMLLNDRHSQCTCLLLSPNIQ